MVNRRQKGIRGELAWRDFLRARGLDARRGQQHSGDPEAPDVIHNLEGFHFEVKNVKRLLLHPSLDQAANDAGEGLIPVVAYKRDRSRGPKGVQWYVLLQATHFLDIVQGTQGDTP